MTFPVTQAPTTTQVNIENQAAQQSKKGSCGDGCGGCDNGCGGSLLNILVPMSANFKDNALMTLHGIIEQPGPFVESKLFISLRTVSSLILLRLNLDFIFIFPIRSVHLNDFL
ncbi:unnamed protein product [Brachionus calyciflorus]|uniref:Uncharacterized protein n=1 Tax=Brachionus calyciflorus TaxID=104777 RepID=A0A813UUC1_9BILA|nr:unnamed protein product [Brachionus calyciflorus]